jgi:2-polyprenyl-3-methyl-5-hydroxy-6-metoxy-1,4-benzoquinol methylase
MAAACPACCSPNANGSYRVPDHEYDVGHVADYTRCVDCGTLFQQPMPTVNELAAYYPARYHSFTAKGLIPALKHRRRLKRLASLVQTPRAVVLDYGCGDGGFIREAAARANGWSFWGFEIADEHETIRSGDGKVTIVRGDPADLFRALPPCDLVTMNHVIEHLPNPLTILTTLNQRLRDGGVLEGQTPAADSLERRVFGSAWSGFHAPRHTVIFSRLGLTKILQRAQFVKARVTPAFNPAGIAVSLASMTHGARGGIIRREGAAWLTYLAAATALYPIDWLSGSPGIVNYAAIKASADGDLPAR